MIVYFLSFLIVYANSYIAKITSNKVNYNDNYRIKLIVILPALISMIIVAGFREGVGTDWFTYYGLISSFYNFNITNLFDSTFNDKGFIILMWFIGQFTQEPQYGFFICSVITIIFIVISITKYGRPFELSMALYITTFSFFSSFNGIRQWLVVAILFWAVQFLFKGFSKRYIIIVLLLSTIHLSALIMIPIYFLVRSSKWKKVSIFLIALFSFSYFFYSGFLDSLFLFMDNTQYGHYQETLLDSSYSANPLRPLVWGIPLLIAYLNQDKLEKEWPNIKYILRLSFLGLLFIIMATKNANFARFSMYFELYNIILIPRLTLIFNKKMNTIMYYIIFISYLFYCFLLLPKDSNVLPYHFFNIFE